MCSLFAEYIKSTCTGLSARKERFNFIGVASFLMKKLISIEKLELTPGWNLETYKSDTRLIKGIKFVRFKHAI